MDETRIKFLENELKDLEAQCADAQKVFQNLLAQANKLRNQINGYRFDAVFKDEITPEKFMAIADWNSLQSEQHKLLRGWITKNYFEKGVHSSGYYPETGQAALKICLDQNRPLEFQLGILDFIPHIKALAGITAGVFRDYKVLGIFEDSLSEHGIWKLIFNDKEIILTFNREEKMHFKNMMEALNYIYNKLPYQRLGASREE